MSAARAVVPPPARDVPREQLLSTVLSEFACTLVTGTPSQAILDRLIARIVEMLPVTGAGVTLLSPGTGPHLVAASSEAAMRFQQLQTSTGEGPCVTAYETGEATAIPDLHRGDERFPRFCTAATEAGLAAMFAFPLGHAGGRLGALDLYRDSPGPLAPADLAIAQTLADVATAYLLNARAHQEARDAIDLLRASTLHDPLTGLPNRVLLEQRLEHAAQRARRSHSPTGVLFVDLDRFKQVNDTYGHDAGDALLVAVARRLTELLRPGDTLARLSGDEFVLLCEDLGRPEDLAGIADRIQQACANPFTLCAGEGPGDGRDIVGSVACTVHITASIGTAFASAGEGIGQQLVRDADFAMYRAKRNGGDGQQSMESHVFVKPGT